MYPAKIHKRANAPLAALHRRVAPAGLSRTRRPPRQTGHRHPVAGFARTLRALLASIDFRQLAGPAAVLFLWPPRPRHGPATAGQDHHRAGVTRGENRSSRRKPNSTAVLSIQL
jgi:hypothetical protein